MMVVITYEYSDSSSDMIEDLAELKIKTNN